MSIVIRRAPAFATLQDEGRRGSRASGVPRSGAMDLVALRTLNAMLGNDSNAAAIELALTGGEIEFTDTALFALGGAECDAQLDGNDIESYRIYRALKGSTLTIREIRGGRFAYIAFGGGLDVPLTMNSRSTYVPGGFGGYDGRRLKNGDAIQHNPSRRRNVVMDRLPAHLIPVANETVRIVARDDSDELVDSGWKISSASDRTGYRLDGVATLFGASITSEPVCPGVIQLPPSGEPIVLMADAPTVGGYRILATVISSDLSALSQLEPGAQVQFENVSIDAAQRAAVDIAERIDAIREWALV